MTVPPMDTARGRLISPYGWRRLGTEPDLHTGIDIAAPVGTYVRAVRAGRVVTSSPPGALGGYGNVIVIDHDGQGFTLYAHLDGRAVSVGDRVAEGQTIGIVGDTGGARGVTDGHVGAPHLHFELLTRWPARPDEFRVDPTRLWPPALHASSSSSSSPAPVPPPVPRSSSSGLGAIFLGLAFWTWQKRNRRGRP